jgi:DNA-binding transcriptional LysR family regulator
MDNLGDIRLFVEAAQQGSLSAAGRKMGLTPPARGWPNSKPA